MNEAARARRYRARACQTLPLSDCRVRPRTPPPPPQPTGGPVNQPTPPTDQQLADYEQAIAAYRQHPDLGFDCCTAHPAADAAAVLLAEVHRLRAQEATLATLTERWERMVAMHSAGHPEGAVVDLSPFQREEAGKSHGYRKATSDVREVLATGRIPHDLMTDDELDAPASVAAVSSATEDGNQ